MSFAFQFLDVALVVIVLASAVYATYRGLVAESLAIFGWIAAAYATLYLGPYCAGWMRTMVEPQWLGEVLGYVVVFLVVLIPLHFAASRIAANVKRSDVGTLDSVLGTGFGILRGIAMIGIAYLLYTAAVPVREQPSWVVGARLHPLMHASAEIVASLIPDPNIKMDGKSVHDRSRKEAEPTIPQLLGAPQDQPFRKADHKADEDTDARPAEPAKKVQNEAGTEHQPATKPVKHVKKTYGAKDRHALDRLIETSHSDASKP
jgi:membrane protein required for colicin V production